MAMQIYSTPAGTLSGAWKPRRRGIGHRQGKAGGENSETTFLREPNGRFCISPLNAFDGHNKNKRKVKVMSKKIIRPKPLRISGKFGLNELPQPRSTFDD